jgi:hypothetical protein
MINATTYRSLENHMMLDSEISGCGQGGLSYLEFLKYMQDKTLYLHFFQEDKNPFCHSFRNLDLLRFMPPTLTLPHGREGIKGMI